MPETTNFNGESIDLFEDWTTLLMINIHFSSKLRPFLANKVEVKKIGEKYTYSD